MCLKHAYEETLTIHFHTVWGLQSPFPWTHMEMTSQWDLSPGMEAKDWTPGYVRVGVWQT